MVERVVFYTAMVRVVLGRESDEKRINNCKLYWTCNSSNHVSLVSKEMRIVRIIPNPSRYSKPRETKRIQQIIH